MRSAMSGAARRMAARRSDSERYALLNSSLIMRAPLVSLVNKDDANAPITKPLAQPNEKTMQRIGRDGRVGVDARRASRGRRGEHLLFDLQQGK